MSQDHLVKLQCTQCKMINYYTRKKRKAEKPEKLERRKLCPKCGVPKVHKESKK